MYPFALSLWPLCVYASLQAAAQNQSVLYRDDSRPPKIIAEGSFQPRDPMMKEDSGFSVFRHVLGAKPGDMGLDKLGFSPDNSVYVATSADPGIAALFLRGEAGYVYKIHASPNMFSVEGTLGKYYKKVSYQQEFVAMGGISWDQVQGYVRVRATKTKFQPGAEFKFKENKGYNPRHNAFVASEGQPQLAGFGVQGHPGQYEEPWKHFREKSTKDYGFEFMTKNKDVKWTQPPLIPLPTLPEEVLNEMKQAKALEQEAKEEKPQQTPEKDKGAEVMDLVSDLATGAAIDFATGWAVGPAVGAVAGPAAPAIGTVVGLAKSAWSIIRKAGKIVKLAQKIDRLFQKGDRAAGATKAAERVAAASDKLGSYLDRVKLPTSSDKSLGQVIKDLDKVPAKGPGSSFEDSLSRFQQLRVENHEPGAAESIDAAVKLLEKMKVESRAGGCATSRVGPTGRSVGPECGLVEEQARVGKRVS